MSSQPGPALVPQPEPTPAPPKEIPELTDAYRKAHKNYVLASGLLTAWELIGITPDTEKWGFKLQSPTAVPLILFILVFYCGYKMTIEWMQCNRDSRAHSAARIDYRMAHITAFLAIDISIIQALLHIQIADTIIRYPLLSGVTVAGTLAVLGGLAVWRIRRRTKYYFAFAIVVASCAWSITTSFAAVLLGKYKISIIAASLSVAAAAVYVLLRNLASKRIKQPIFSPRPATD